jgi:nucleoside 2-deoxyribosyltransferase
MLQEKEKFDPGLLFRENLIAIDRAKIVVAILDGADADSGTAWECSYAYTSAG